MLTLGSLRCGIPYASMRRMEEVWIPLAGMGFTKFKISPPPAFVALGDDRLNASVHGEANEPTGRGRGNDLTRADTFPLFPPLIASCILPSSSIDSAPQACHSRNCSRLVSDQHCGPPPQTHDPSHTTGFTSAIQSIPPGTWKILITDDHSQALLDTVYNHHDILHQNVTCESPADPAGRRSSTKAPVGTS